MAEFCECGSLIFDGRCSNKNCVHRGAVKSAPEKKKSIPKIKVSGKSLDAIKPSIKAPNPRRASKCITYNLYDNKDKEDES